MRSLFVAALGLLASMHVGPAAAQPVGPPNQIWCNRTAVVASGPATVSVVAGVAGRATSICGWIASATAAATMTIITGTGATCGTGTASITAVHAIPAGGAQAVNGGNAFYSAPAGNNVCMTVGGTGPVQMTLFYAQF
jgi:hypothetical protein